MVHLLEMRFLVLSFFVKRESAEVLMPFLFGHDDLVHTPYTEARIGVKGRSGESPAFFA